MLFFLGVFGAILMGAMELIGDINVGWWWCLVPIVFGTIAQLVAMATGKSNEGCLAMGGIGEVVGEVLDFLADLVT